jgi:Ser/Thr protein kinase RdoA (MazF antagonist)
LFAPSIHDNIRAVTTALAAAGLVTPMLVPTNDGGACLELSASTPAGKPKVWRLMTHIEGTSFDVVAGSLQAHAAGALVARFHVALDGLSHSFSGLRESVHDTSRHMDHLRRTCADRQDHRLFGRVAPLAARILDSARTLPSLPSLAPRICHGDLKFNNLLFAGPDTPERDRAVCLVDLDTVGPMPLAFEMGDAWRSWCNRSGEDDEQADLDLELFGASLEGYQEGLTHDLGDDERRALLLGPEWISLELGARFAADALAESYFGWDSRRFAGRGEHNLVRAHGQVSLHLALLASREHRARLLGVSL